MAAPGVVVVYEMPYRGDTEQWSQKYHFTGSAPSDHAGWVGLVTDLVALIRPCLGGINTIVSVYCYDNTDNDAVDHVILADESITGTGEQNVGSGEYLAPGDAAAWCRWKTARVNTHGRPIYLRKYFHGIVLTPADGDADTIAGHVKTAMETFATAVNASSGDWPGIAGPDGVAPGASSASKYVTTRTLKRRGRRP